MKHSQTGIARKFLFLMVGLLCAIGAQAQSFTVSGTVTDPDGEPLIGASILAKGTSNGTATDIDGHYSINVAPNGTLVVSYVGYDTQEVNVDDRSTINVTMSENSVMLNEVVAIGYGVVKKSDATGSVAVIKPDEIEAGLATSVQDMLVGQTPGVVVSKSGGPFGSATIRVRGEASLSANTNPLIVLDGVPLTSDAVLGLDNPLSMINPENIESMTVLKDASATAIYGSRASNGVIIITSKKGTSGKPQVTFSANMYVDYARKTQKVLNASEFRNLIASKFGTEGAEYRGLGEYDTNWQDEIYRTAISQDYSLSIGGTAGILPYRVSATYTKNNGIVKTSGMERGTFGFNLTPKFFDNHLSVSANAKGYYVKSNFNNSDAIGQAVAFNPTAPVRDNQPIVGGTAFASGYRYLFNGYTEPYSVDGTTYNLLNDGTYNPVASLEQTHNQSKVFRSNGNLQLDYSFHFLPELHANLNLGYDVTKSYDYYGVDANSHMAWKDHSKYGGSWERENHAFTSNTLLDFYLNYRKDIEKIYSNIDVTAGYSWQRFAAHGDAPGANSDQGIATTTGLLPTYMGPDGLMLDWNDATIGQVGEPFKRDPVDKDGNYHWRNHLQLLSFFGRLNYTFMDRYLLTFTVRGDATSRFSPENRWGVFPAVALGWKINDEAFMQSAAGWLTDLKLRLGWGQTGQQAVGSTNNYTPTYTAAQPGSYYPDGNGGWLIPAFPNGYNKDLTWETTTTWNIGIDYGFLNNRITGSIEAYLRDTDDLLSEVAVAAGSSTVNKLPQNIGSMRNYGVEFAIVARPIVTNDFNWTVSYNVGWNHNEITDLNGLTFSTGGGFGGTGGDCQIQMEGYPIYSYYLYQQVYDDNGDPIQGAYVDQNGDGIIDGNDRVVHKSALPDVTMTLGMQFRYKKWDLGFSLRSSLGNYVYASALRGGSTTDGIFRNGYSNVFKTDYYFNSNENYSDYWVRNASFLRCDNITLGYTFDDLLRNKLNLRLFAGVQNPFVITKYDGVDPEVANGVDGNIYPRSTTWSLGLVATF